MKTVITATAIAFFALANTPALAQSGHAGMHHGASHDAGMPMANTKMSNGTVKKLDAAAGKITIAHGPLENLSMPAMTMIFNVPDKAALKAIKPGDKINFVAANAVGGMAVTQLELAK